jgi:hypothetical protein
MRRISATLAATLAVGFAFSASAADLPVKVPITAAATYADGFYSWVDGSYQSVRLPTFDLGWRTTSPALVVTNGGTAFESYNPRANGAGVAGALGYVFHDGTFPAAFGSNVSLELGASYTHADVKQSAASPTPQSGFIVTLDGNNQTGAGGVTSSSTLSSEFSAWQVNLKAAGDYRFGTMTVTPSLAVFAGNARNQQNFLQSIAGVVPIFPGTYQADANTRWNDFGARLGLDTKFEITAWAALGLGGYVGLANRHTSLSANDVSTLTNPGPHPPNTIGGTSAIEVNADTTPFLANAEAHLILKPWSRVALSGFVGLNYDSRVPGIAAPVVNGPCCTGLNPGTPAGIKFQPETSYYAGGGAVVTFAP